MTTYARRQADSIVPFNGLAASWEVNTNQWRFERGAFRQSIKDAEESRRRREGNMLWPVLAHHLLERAYGWVATARETEDGLWIEGYLDPQTEETQKALLAAKKGYADGMSLGIEILRDHYEGSVRVIDQCDIYEVSTASVPVDQNARIHVKAFSDLEHSMMRAIHQEQEAKNMEFGDYSNVTNPLVSTPETPSGFGYEPGDEMESRTLFEAELRRERREADPELGLLEPGGRQFRKVVAQRAKAKEEKLRKMQEAYAQEKREREARSKAWRRDSFTPEVYSELTMFDLAWCRAWFDQAIRTGFVTALHEGTLEVSRGDLTRLMNRDAEMLEQKAISLRNKRLAGRAA